MNIKIDKDCLLSCVTIDSLKSVLTDLYGVSFKREGGAGWRSNGKRSVRISERALLWYNFETGDGGDFFEAVRLLENIQKGDFNKTLEAASNRIGYLVEVPPEEDKKRKEKANKYRAEREAAEAEQRQIEANFLEAANEAFVLNRETLEQGLTSPECVKALKSRGLTPDMLRGYWCGYNASDNPIKTKPICRRFADETPDSHTIIKPHSFAFYGVSKGVKSIAIDPETGHKRKIEYGKDKDGKAKTRADIVCTPSYSYRLNDGDGGPLYLCEGEFDALTIANATAGAIVWATHANESDMKEILKNAKNGKYAAIYLAFDNDEAGDKFTATAKTSLATVEIDVLDVRQAFNPFKDINDKLQSLCSEGLTEKQALNILNIALKEAQSKPLSPREKAENYLRSLEQYLANHTFGKYCTDVDPKGAHDHTALYCALALASINCANTRFINDGSELTRVIFAHLVGAPKSGKSYAIEKAIINPLCERNIAIDSMDIPEEDTLSPNTVILHEVDDNSPEALRNSVQNAYCIRKEGDEGSKIRIIQRRNKPILVRVSKEFSLSQSDKKNAELRRYESITNELADGKCKASRALWRNSDKDKYPTCDGVKYIELDASQFKTFKQFIRTARDNASGYVRRSYMLKCGWNVEGGNQIECIQNESTARRTCMTPESCRRAASLFIAPFNQTLQTVTITQDLLPIKIMLANILAEYRGRAELWLNKYADGVRDTDEADNVGDYAVTLLDWFSCLAAAVECRDVVTENDLYVAACIARRVADCEMWVDGAEAVSDYNGQLINEFKELLGASQRARELFVVDNNIMKRREAVNLWLMWAPRNVGIERFKVGTKTRKAFRLLTSAEKEKRDKLINSPEYKAPTELKDVRAVCEL